MRKKDIVFYGCLIFILGTFFSAFFLIPLSDSSDHIYVVVSGSMEPTLHVGDVVVVKKVDPKEVHRGDIITFRRGDYRVTHRCVYIINKESEREFITKGDANKDFDSQVVQEKDLIGKVPSITVLDRTFYLKIPYLGYLSRFVHTFWGYLFLVVIPSLGLIGTSVYDISIMFFDKNDAEA